MSLELFSLKGRTALVTGSSRGLGHAIAVALAGAGARIVLNGVDAQRLAQSAAALRAEGHDVLESCFNVTDEASVTAAFERLDGHGVAVDVLVNNAGIQFRKPLIDLATDEWRRVIETNLTSAFVVGREAARRMIPRKRGKIINIVSLTSEVARATIAPYTASKGGLKMLTRSMTAEWAEHGIQINGIGPGYMITDMNEALLSNQQFDGWVKARTPARRWGKPEELAGAAIFLASSASDYISGQMIYIDGGILAVI
jgi:gluconate 5-dehydrogenase